MRILILVHNIVRKGGAYYRGQGFAKYLAARGHDVTLMGIAAEDRMAFTEEQTQGVRIVHSPDLLWGIGRTGWDPWDTIRRCGWLHDKQYDIVHTVDTRPAVVLPALYVRKRCGAKFVADWTDWWGRGGTAQEREGWAVRTFVGPLELFFEEAFRPGADATIAISRALYQRALGLGIKESTMHYQPPGCDVTDIQPLEKSVAREKLGLESGAQYVGYLGNIYQRDADLLASAMLKLKQAPQAKLIMIGGAKAQMPAELEKAGRLVQPGHIPFPDMIAYLSACDVLALPLSDSIANRGRWPSKINDYMAVGRPTVSSSVGDLVDIFHQDDIGRLAGEGADNFSEHLDSLLTDQKLADKMGQNARALAESKYSCETVAESLEGFYQKVLSS